MEPTDYEQKKREFKKKMLAELFKTKKALVNYENDIFNYTFDRAYSLGKQAKDAEGEEMLTVSRKKVQEEYAIISKELSNRDTDAEDYIAWNYAKMTFEELFGSKCLPDEEQPKQKDCDNPLADKEGCRWRNDGKCAFDSACYFEPLNPQEPKPAEPKFKVGDKVECLLNHHIYVIRHLDFYDGIWRYNYGNPAIWIKESDLELYTEPTFTDDCQSQCKSTSASALDPKNVEYLHIASEESLLRNLSQETANCDKQFDTILKDSFAKERRLNIAVHIAQALIQGVNFLYAWSDDEIKDVAYNSMRFADALIVEASKKRDR